MICKKNINAKKKWADLHTDLSTIKLFYISMINLCYQDTEQ